MLYSNYPHYNKYPVQEHRFACPLPNPNQLDTSPRSWCIAHICSWAGVVRSVIGGVEWFVSSFFFCKCERCGSNGHLGVTSSGFGTSSLWDRLNGLGLLDLNAFLTGPTRMVMCCFRQNLSVYHAHLVVMRVHGMHLTDWVSGRVYWAVSPYHFIDGLFFHSPSNNHSYIEKREYINSVVINSSTKQCYEDERY